MVLTNKQCRKRTNYAARVTNLMDHKIRPIEDSCLAGKQFDYYCENCSLHLHGYYKTHYVEKLTGWTWELTRENTGDLVATAGKLAQNYGGTEKTALDDGLQRFSTEPCRKLNRQMPRRTP